MSLLVDCNCGCWRLCLDWKRLRRETREGSFVAVFVSVFSGKDDFVSYTVVEEHYEGERVRGKISFHCSEEDH